MEPEKRVSTEVSNKNIDPITYFEDDSNFVFVYKKTEKLASAMYMITNLFSDSEPMKWNLRKKVSELLSFSLSYKDISESTHNDFVYNIKSRVLELVSLLEVSLRGGLLSNMNFSILKQEFFNLIDVLGTINSDEKESSNKQITKDFFEVSETNINGSNINNLKEVNTQRSPIPRMSFTGLKDKSPLVSRDEFKRTNRQNIILGLLKKKKELTIKDIALVIKDCSEKTIQRELISFINAGVLKRTGERRWSKYSLA